MANSIKFVPDAQRSIAFSGISASYANIGTALAYPSRMFSIWNTTDALLQFSYDGGVTDHFVIPAGAGMVYDVGSNQEANGNAWYLPVGTQFAVKRIGTPSEGTVYLSVSHGEGK